MAIRPIRRADLPRLRQALDALPNPPYYPTDDDLWEATQAQSFTVVDTTLPGVCRIAYDREQKRAWVVWLLPRAAWTVNNFPALRALVKATVRAGLRALKNAHGQTVAGWKISASFAMRRLNEQTGQLELVPPDGGRQLCEWWRDHASPGATVQPVGDGTWEASHTFSGADEDLQASAVP